jgi:HAD superfamily hydrolase (TIGR01509 family)
MPREREAIVHKGGTDREILLGLLPGIGKETLKKMVGMAAGITSPLKYLKLNPGAKEAIRRLSKTRKLAIVSNDNRPNVERKLEMFGIRKYFPVIVTENDVKKAKPDAEPLLKAMELLGVKREESVYIGDNEVDRLAGKAAGVKTIIRTDLRGDREFFKKELMKIVGA